MLEVRRIEPAIGAEIVCGDLAAITDEDFSRIYRAFLEHCVLVVKRQTLSMPDFLTYSRRFGPLVPHSLAKTRHADHPELTVMGENAVHEDGRPNLAVRERGLGWHTDGAFLGHPQKATQLYGVEIPSSGGDTLFANMYAAYDSLPERLKTRIAGLRGSFRLDGKQTKAHTLADKSDLSAPEVQHPIVAVHPDTGRKSLYINPVHIVGIADMPAADGSALLEELFTYMLQPGCQYRHVWDSGDVVIWDNRCTVHSATGDYPIGERRIHWRTTIANEPARLTAAAN